MRNRRESFLVSRFRELYRELDRLRDEAGGGTWAAYPEPPEGEGEEESSAPSGIWQRLLALLERQSMEARRRGGEVGERLYREAQYVMAALADEVFLHLDWPGRTSWSSNLLEAKLFGTHRAGEAIFRRLDEILAGRDPVHTDLAKVYLMCLALGFEGRYRDAAEGPTRLAAYRRRLLDLIREHEPALRGGGEHLFEPAYASTLDQGADTRLPYLRRWLIGFPVVIAAWVVLSGLVWWVLTAGLRPIVERMTGAGG